MHILMPYPNAREEKLYFDVLEDVGDGVTQAFWEFLFCCYTSVYMYDIFVHVFF